MSPSSGSEGEQHPHCLECDYDLTGTPGDRCPWCGWPIDVHALAAAVAQDPTARRVGVGLTGLAFGVGSLVAVSSLVSQGKALALYDGLIVVAVFIAAAGHLYLGVLALFSGPRWPMRPGEAAKLLRLVGWVAVVLALAGASRALVAPVPPQGVRGIAVNRTFEFGLRAVFFGFPGVALLTLRMISFQPERGRRRRRWAAIDSSGDRPAAMRNYAIHGSAPFAIEILGRYTRGEVSQSLSDEQRPTTAAAEAAIQRTWETLQAMAKESNRPCYNGTLGRLVSATASSGALNLRLSSTCYRDFVGTHLPGEETRGQIDLDVLANPLGTSITPITSDGFLVLGRRSDRVIHHTGYLHCFGGMLEEMDRRPDGYDVFGAATRELGEELGVCTAEVSDLVAVGLIRDRVLRQPELMFEASLQLSRALVESRFNPELAAGEHSDIVFLYDDPETVCGYLLATDRLTPIAQAALLLHGRHAWGSTWYEQTCYVCYGELPEAWQAASETSTMS